MRNNVVRIAVLVLTAVLVASLPARGEETSRAMNVVTLPDTFEAQDQVAVEAYKEASASLMARDLEAAVERFRAASAFYEQKYNKPGVRYLCARSQQEMAEVSAELVLTSKDRDFRFVPMLWASSYFWEGYTLIELKNWSEAKTALERAIALSPRNAKFISELGHVHQMEKDFPAALETFHRAEEAAAVSPMETRDQELARAWRGQGYALIEMGRLDEAEKFYHRCLSLDSSDRRAQSELIYIQRLRAKSGGK